MNGVVLAQHPQRSLVLVQELRGIRGIVVTGGGFQRVFDRLVQPARQPTQLLERETLDLLEHPHGIHARRGGGTERLCGHVCSPDRCDVGASNRDAQRSIVARYGSTSACFLICDRCRQTTVAGSTIPPSGGRIRTLPTRSHGWMHAVQCRSCNCRRLGRIGRPCCGCWAAPYGCRTMASGCRSASSACATMRGGCSVRNWPRATPRSTPTPARHCSTKTVTATCTPP